MMIVTNRMTREELKRLAEGMFGSMVKGVVDVDRGIIAVDGELHSDLEALLIEDGSEQRNLWGINLYPELEGSDFVEFDSMINVRPSQGNMSRLVEDERTRETILTLVAKWIER